MIKRIISLSFITLFFSSCISLAPKLEINKEDIVPNELKNNEDLSEYSQITLDNFIEDESLKRIVNLALKNNKDIQIALLNIEASKALYRIEESQYFPTLDASGNFIRQKTDSAISNNYKANLGTSFELDLFGRIKSLNDVAKNNFLATKYASQTTKLSLISQTINSYLSLVSNIYNLKLSKDILKNLEDVYSLTQKKYDIGITNKEDVLSSYSTLKDSQNDILNFETQIQKDLNSLEFLTSSRIDLESINDDFINEKYLKLISTGISSNVLFNRPDIFEAEYNLRSKNANIGVARAAFFPSISLTASTGYASSSLSNLFSGTNIWQFSPSINLPIFSGGENMAKLDLSNTQKEIALKEYQKAIQNAFKEVNDALATRKNITQRVENQKELVKSLFDTYNIALNSYKIGYGTYLNMLISQRAYINAQKNLVKIYLEELENRNELFKTLGGNLE
ncbi:efflux transporter outer membrane subunit [Aliarcobacter lanthieri]|uniref:efflux transporter outer membrane subunit n=1 Tax=Aliarcobacter lanthieri TaxID=1355374 RepID=UPI000478B1D8|nr:efflux transporter outer membrane subunit [Aliarcobacter lanthieri]QKF60261.1 RND family efflux system, outer membrane channel protein, TolC family [Aliarcobacter lanthieri]